MNIDDLTKAYAYLLGPLSFMTAHLLECRGPRAMSPGG
jgi:hypothetical protein